jgi:t-SNARE complex subunit (syntaxin)
MFKDLGKFVDQQGEMIDQIEVHVEKVLERTQEGVKQLEAAAKKQKECIVM